MPRLKHSVYSHQWSVRNLKRAQYLWAINLNKVHKFQLRNLLFQKSSKKNLMDHHHILVAIRAQHHEIFKLEILAKAGNCNRQQKITSLESRLFNLDQFENLRLICCSKFLLTMNLKFKATFNLLVKIR